VRANEVFLQHAREVMNLFSPPPAPAPRPAIDLPLAGFDGADVETRSLPPVLIVALVGKAIALAWWSLMPWPHWAALFFFGPDVFVMYHVFVPSAQGLCRVFTHFATDRNEVWLTIDDGPDESDTPRILDLLDRYGARATFFLVGERAARRPDLVAAILGRGHEVAHHTQTHPAATFWCASPRRLAAELDRASVVFASAGAAPRRFRPPAGIKPILLGRALELRGLDCIGWSVRSGDCLARRAEDVVASVLRRLRPGAIILVHEGSSVPSGLRVKTIALLLEAFAARNFACVIPGRTQLRWP
jgi:peptidoglycan-N-acetylglucosamine deacetylase